jgi:hypothetical protein
MITISQRELGGMTHAHPVFLSDEGTFAHDNGLGYAVAQPAREVIVSGTAHRGWSGAPLSDNDLMKEGVWRDGENANLMDQSVSERSGCVHNQLGVLPSADILDRLPGLISNNGR